MIRKVLTKNIQIEANDKKVFEAFVNPDIIKKWLTAHSAVVVACKNGPYTIGWDASEKGDFYCFSGRIKDFVRYKTLIITELNYFSEGKKFIGPIELNFKFKKKGNSTEVNFKLIGNNKGNAWLKNFDAVFCSWEEAFYLLKKHLERRN